MVLMYQLHFQFCLFIVAQLRMKLFYVVYLALDKRHSNARP
jgi:hypothetical protein